MENQNKKPKMIRRSRNLRRCIVGCKNERSDKNLHFYSLPSDPQRRARWLTLIKLPDMPGTHLTHYVCSKHFERSFISPSGRWRLMKGAEPTLNLPHLLPGTASDTNIQTTPALTSSQDTQQLNADKPIISTYTHVPAVKRQQVSDLQEYYQPTKLVKVKDEIEALTVVLEDDDEERQAQLNDYQLASKLEEQPEEKKKSQKLHSTEYFLLALALYFKSPLSYRVLRKSFNLPSVGVLYRLCLPKTTELSQQVFSALKIKADGMTPAEKQCVVCVGTMRLKPTVQYDVRSDRITGFHEVDGVQVLKPARTLLVVMVRGLFHNWKQAIAYAFLSDSHNNYDHVKLFIDEVIVRLFSIGLQVRVLMSDRDTDFVTGGNKRQICSNNPFTIVDNHKIYYMYDPPYLMKYIRDHMLIHDYIFYNHSTKLVAKWQHVVECFHYDHKRQFFRLAPHLSIKHIHPVRDAADDLNVVSEVFSRTTAAAIDAYIDLNLIKPDAKHTVQWITTMYKLKEILNFSVSGSREEKDKIIPEETFSLFSHLYSVPAGSRNYNTFETPKPSQPPFVEYVRITINSINLLYNNLEAENFSLPAIGLTRDCLTEFFDKIRGKYGTKTTTKQVVMCMNKFPIFNIFQYSNRKRESVDMETFILHARLMPDAELYDLDPPAPFVDACDEACAEFSLIELPTEHRLDHLALYLLHKGYQQHKHCEQMESYADTYEIIKNDALYISVRPSDNDIGDATPREFVEFIEMLDIKFKDYFKEIRLTRSISDLLSFMRNVTFEMPCECFPIDYVKQLFLRCRLHIVLKYNNKMYWTWNNSSFVINDL